MATREEKIAAAKKRLEQADAAYVRASIIYGDLSETADNASADAVAAKVELDYELATAVDD